LFLLLCQGAICDVSAAPLPNFYYQCRISRDDLVRRKDGVALATIPNIKPQDILLQDRLNFHKFGIRDPEDTNDQVYRSDNQQAFVALYEDLPLVVQNPSVAALILNGNPLLQVNVQNGSIEVKVLRFSSESQNTALLPIVAPQVQSVNSQGINSSFSQQSTFGKWMGPIGLDLNTDRLLVGTGIILLSMLLSG
jgi:hypothetical protein